MTVLDHLKSDVVRSKERMLQMILKEPDNEFALVMYEADVFRARRALDSFEEAAELRTLRGIVRADQVEMA